MEGREGKEIWKAGKDDGAELQRNTNGGGSRPAASLHRHHLLARPAANSVLASISQTPLIVI